MRLKQLIGLNVRIKMDAGSVAEKLQTTSEKIENLKRNSRVGILIMYMF